MKVIMVGMSFGRRRRGCCCGGPVGAKTFGLAQQQNCSLSERVWQRRPVCGLGRNAAVEPTAQQSRAEQRQSINLRRNARVTARERERERKAQLSQCGSGQNRRERSWQHFGRGKTKRERQNFTESKQDCTRRSRRLLLIDGKNRLQDRKREKKLEKKELELR